MEKGGDGGGGWLAEAAKGPPPSPPTPPASPVEPRRRRGGVIRGVAMSSAQKVWGLKAEIKKARKNGPFYSKNFYLTPNQGSGRVGFGEGNLKGAL